MKNITKVVGAALNESFLVFLRYCKVVCSIFVVLKVMVFVHARNETVRTANVLCEIARNSGQMLMFAADKSARLAEALKQVSSVLL